MRHCVVVEVEDNGPGFGSAIGGRGADDETERGRGLAVVRSLVDEFSVSRRRGITTVRGVVNR